MSELARIVEAASIGTLTSLTLPSLDPITTHLAEQLSQQAARRAALAAVRRCAEIADAWDEGRSASDAPGDDILAAFGLEVDA